VVEATFMQEHALRTSNAEAAPAAGAPRVSGDRPGMPEGTAGVVSNTDRPTA